MINMINTVNLRVLRTSSRKKLEIFNEQLEILI